MTVPHHRMRRVFVTVTIGLVLVLGAGIYLYLWYHTLFLENEPASPDLFRLLAAGGALSVGLLLLFTASVHWMTDRPAADQADEEVS